MAKDIFPKNMEENTPIQTPQTSTPTPTTGGKKWQTPAIIIGIIVFAVGGYTTYHRWQQSRDINAVLNDLNLPGATEIIGDTMANYASQMSEEAARLEAEAKKTPQDKFNEATTIDIGDNGKKVLADGVTPIIASVFGDTKITGYTSGYMGMNSGSGVIQFMAPNTLDAGKANELSKKLEEDGYEISNLTVDQQSASLTATKNSVNYTFSFNTGDQSVTLIVLNTHTE